MTQRSRIEASLNLMAYVLVLQLWGANYLLAADHPTTFDTTKRTLWTTSRVHGSPDAENPYRTEVAFSKAKFFEPLELVQVPDSDLLAVAERPGKVFAFDSRSRESEKQLLFDTQRVTYSLAFHPQFARNGFVYVTTEHKRGEMQPVDIEVLRYRLNPQTLKLADTKAMLVIAWGGEGHRGGCLRFGPDGYLYVVVGDGSGIGDQLQTGQDVSDLLASLLRIDVDSAPEGRGYVVPKDNPFVGKANTRSEIWAYGLRQAWKFCFHPQSKELWAGEVGQDLWEMIYIIKRGGNYGWSVKEGNHPFRPERPLGPTAIELPITEHPHSEFRSITGGHFSATSRLPELRGAYIYGDYDSGKIWMLRYDAGKVTEKRELADTQLRVVSFGQDRAGEVYVVDFTGGQIHRLVAAPKTDSSEADRFPKKLSETGLFSSTRDLTPAPGLIPYSVNAALWSDGASKDRFIALPDDSKIEFETLVYPQGAPGALPGWRFPHDTVLVKTFHLELEAGNPASRRRLETRLLHYKQMPGTDEYGGDFWRGYTYIWNDAQTEAVLAPGQGVNQDFTITDAAAPGGKRTQVWRFPSRTECTLCHNMAAKYALGVTTQQMNKSHDYGRGVIGNQLEVLERLNVFTKPLPARPAKLAKLANYEDSQADLAARARSYLESNCAHCHRKWGGGNAEFQLLASLPAQELGILNVKPQHGRFDLNDPRLIAPGDPSRSVVLSRMKRTGLGRMPHIASNIVHEEAAKLVEQWIQEMK